MPRVPTPTLRTALAAGVLGAGAAVSARALLRPRTAPRAGAEPKMIDWATVRRVARERSGDATARFDAVSVAARCDAIAAELAPLMTEVTQQPLVHFPRFAVIDRHGFIDVNVGIAARLVQPIEELRRSLGESAPSAAGRTVMSRYVGVLFGIMSQRVLGQYDPVLALGDAPVGASPALYIVEPNLAEFTRVAGAEIEPLRRWLILHELTHAWQFGEHPWLREHLMGMFDTMVRSGLVKALGDGGSKPTARQVIERLPGAVQAQLRGVSQLQATMTVLEGYANFVMHRVGRQHLDDFDDLEAAFARRRSQRSVVERIVLALTGISMKLRQYEVGERFCERVTAAGGLDLLNRVWEGPQLLPTSAELSNPDAWVARAR